MPYKSAAQRAYLHIHEPEVAAKWDAEYGAKQRQKPKAVGKARPTKRKRKAG